MDFYSKDFLSVYSGSRSFPSMNIRDVISLRFLGTDLLARGSIDLVQCGSEKQIFIIYDISSRFIEKLQR